MRRRCLALCEEQGIGDCDIAFACEAIARAVRVGGDHPRRGGRTGASARELAAEIAEDDDRELVLSDLASDLIDAGAASA